MQLVGKLKHTLQLISGQGCVVAVTIDSGGTGRL
jgi:hypothetical protein